ncbi:MAG: YggS family pyridoxal phosphate-dependent enzyme [Pelagibacteraceae bacterium]|nr:YggS family pyridoxal phosphate-dependent enzyme [Pelagibacteraceae bacterium]MBO6491941.1 YggS family pyridoxal phosphate-dependent enzyme [Pelagibacteraceae bacterium]
MHNVVERLMAIQSEIKELLIKNNLQNKDLNIIIICKTFSMDKILPLIDAGHVHFGENKVQEAESKWKEVKEKHPNIKLHMVGKLQTNKVKTALNVFDYIHSVDNYRLGEKIVKYEKELNKKIKTFVQVNIGEESQKSGISPKNVNQFVNYCKNNLSLNIIGLMCLPPINDNSEKYFLHLNQLKNQTDLCHLSMGMSDDYQTAIKCGSTFLRIGSKILGERNIG